MRLMRTQGELLGCFTEKGKTMKPYEIVMLAILVALEIPAIIILTVGWVKACKEARERIDNG